MTSTGPARLAWPQSFRKGLERAIDAAVSVQQPTVARHVQRMRDRRPDAKPADIIQSLERQFLTTVTGIGAAAGGSAAVPGFGTGVALALSAGDTAAFLDASGLLCLAVADIHGVQIDDLERRRTLLLATLFGDGGVTFVEMAAGRTGKHWGTLLTDKIPSATIKEINSILGRWLVTRYGTKRGILAIGRIAPFGIGAAIGGGGNALLGRSVVAGIRRAFGPPPEDFPTPDVGEGSRN